MTKSKWIVADSWDKTDGRLGFVCSLEVTGNRPGINEANARLIAAAPELLEACQAAVFGANHIDCVRAMQEVLPRIRAAIKKAGAQ